jgi:DNA polymerase-3 subunit epsilon
LENRHRAEGDAAATSLLFVRLVETDEGKVLTAMTKGKNAEQFLPPHLPVEALDQLPQGPGVYYFESAKKQVLYVGKAVNLNKRVRTHFSNNDKGKRKQELMRQVHHIRYTQCASELMALILESQEIRQLWPPFNRSQKKYHHRYGLYSYENRNGMLQLVIEKKRTNLPALHTFNWLQEGQQFMRRVKEKMEKEDSLQLQEPLQYNQYLTRAIDEYRQQLPSVALVEKDHYFTKRYAVYLLEKGKFWGMGYLEDPYAIGNQLDSWKEKISPSPDNDYIRGLLYQSLTSGARISIPLED